MLRRIATLAAVAVCAAAPAVASADEIHAAPEASGAVCGPAQPCDITFAVNTAAGDGDEVILAPGFYFPTTSLQLTGGDENVTIRPRDPGTKPVIASTASVAVQIQGAGDKLRGVEIQGLTAAGTGFSASGAGVEVHNVISTVPGTACQLGDGILTDSICHATGQFGTAFRTSVSFGDVAGTIRNSTLIAPRSDAVGIYTSAQEPTDSVQLDVRSSIVQGGLVDVLGFTFGGSGGDVVMDVASSNFESSNLETGATVTSPFTAGNQMAEPVFANGGYEQAPGSPTIDAGSVDAKTGTTDVFGDARPQGAANDIGADELAVTVPPADTSPPDTFITKSPRTRSKKRTARFAFATTEPAATFECKLDRGAFEPCTDSPKLKRLKRRRHTLAVRSTDAAGNTDATPATAAWKVKRKRK